MAANVKVGIQYTANRAEAIAELKAIATAAINIFKGISSSIGNPFKGFEEGAARAASKAKEPYKRTAEGAKEAEEAIAKSAAKRAAIEEQYSGKTKREEKQKTDALISEIKRLQDRRAEILASMSKDVSANARQELQIRQKEIADELKLYKQVALDKEGVSRGGAGGKVGLLGTGRQIVESLPGGSGLAAFAGGPAVAVAAGAGLVVAGLSKAVASAKEFEDAMADMSAITGVGGTQLAGLGTLARNVGMQFGVDGTQGVTAMKLIISSLGPEIAQNKGEMEKLTVAAMTLQKASGLDLETATKSLVGTLNQFNLTGKDAERVMNALAAGAKEGNAEVPDLAESFKTAGTIASMMNLSVEQSAAAIEVLAKAEIKGGEAGTGFRNVLLKMSSGSKEANNALGSVGLTFNDINPKAVGLQKGLETLRAKFEAIKSPTEQAAFLQKMFGAENAAAATQLLRNTELLADYTKKMTGTNTASEQAAGKMETLSEKSAKLFNGLQTLLSPTAEAMVSFFGTIVGGINKILDLEGQMRERAEYLEAKARKFTATVKLEGTSGIQVEKAKYDEITRQIKEVAKGEENKFKQLTALAGYRQKSMWELAKADFISIFGDEKGSKIASLVSDLTSGVGGTTPTIKTGPSGGEGGGEGGGVGIPKPKEKKGPKEKKSTELSQDEIDKLQFDYDLRVLEKNAEDTGKFFDEISKEQTDALDEQTKASEKFSQDEKKGYEVRMSEAVKAEELLQKKKLDLMEDGLAKQLALEEARYQKERDLAEGQADFLALIEQEHSDNVAAIKARDIQQTNTAYKAGMSIVGSTIEQGLGFLDEAWKKSLGNQKTALFQGLSLMTGAIKENMAAMLKELSSKAIAFIAENLAVAASFIATAIASAFAWMWSINPLLALGAGATLFAGIMFQWKGIKKTLGFNAEGGVTKGPIFSPLGGGQVAGEAGPEAIIPLHKFPGLMAALMKEMGGGSFGPQFGPQMQTKNAWIPTGHLEELVSKGQQPVAGIKQAPITKDDIAPKGGTTILFCGDTNSIKQIAEDWGLDNGLQALGGGNVAGKLDEVISAVATAKVIDQDGFDLSVKRAASKRKDNSFI